MPIGPNYRDFIEGVVLNPVTERNEPPNNRLTDQPIPVVYGLQRINPPIMWYRLSDYDSRDLIVTYALSEGPCQGIYRLFVEDVYVETDQAMDDTNGVTNTIVEPLSGPFANVAEFEFMTGKEYALGNTSLILNNIANPLDRPEYEDELCYLVVKYRWTGDDNSPYRDIPKLTIDLFGKQVPKSSPSDNLNLEYSTNPAKVLWDFMVNERYGAGFDASILDTTSWQSAVTYFDANTNVTLTNGQLIVTKRVTTNVVLNTSNTVRSNLDSLLNACFGYIPYIDGKFIFDIEKADTPEVDFTENSLVGEVKVAYPDVGSRYNSVNYTFLDAEKDFTKVRKRYPVSDSDVNALIAQDNGHVNQGNFEFFSLTDPHMAERIARQYLEKSRNQLKFNFRVYKDAWQYKVGDVCRIKTLVPDLDYVEVRIISIAFNEDNTLDIEAYGHDDTWYTPFTDFFQVAEDYKKPLIPTPGGVLVPTIPAQPISINPPTTPNPGPGDPGNPGEPDTAPILPVQPGVPLPSVPPDEPTYFLNPTNVTNGASIPTVGNQNQYYIGYLETNTPAYIEEKTYELDEGYVGSTQNARLEFIEGAGQKGYYRFRPALTHRNLDETEIAYVYEVLPGQFGFAPTDPLRSTFVYLWDPEVGGLKVTESNLQGSWLNGETDFESPPFIDAMPRLNRRRGGAHYDTGTGIVFGVHSGVFNYARPTDYRKGGMNIRYPETYDLHGDNSAVELDFTVKFFTIRNKSTTGFTPQFIKHIGNVNYKIANSEMTPKWLTAGRNFYRRVAPFQTPPF